MSNESLFAHSSWLVAHNQNQYAPQHTFHISPHIPSSSRFYSLWNRQFTINNKQFTAEQEADVCSYSCIGSGCDVFSRRFVRRHLHAYDGIGVKMDSIRPVFLGSIQNADRHSEDKERNQPLSHREEETSFAFVGGSWRQRFHRRTHGRLHAFVPESDTLYHYGSRLRLGDSIHTDTILQNETHCQQPSQRNILSDNRCDRNSTCFLIDN